MKVMSASEKQAMQIRVHAGQPVDGSLLDDAAPPAADPFAIVADLVKAATGDSKKALADLAKQSAEARTLRDLAAKDRAAVDEHARSEEKRLTAAGDQIDAERKAHDAFVAGERASIAAEHKAATAAREAGEKIKADAQALKAELQKRLRAVEQAVNG